MSNPKSHHQQPRLTISEVFEIKPMTFPIRAERWCSHCWTRRSEAFSKQLIMKIFYQFNGACSIVSIGLECWGGQEPSDSLRMTLTSEIMDVSLSSTNTCAVNLERKSTLSGEIHSVKSVSCIIQLTLLS